MPDDNPPSPATRPAIMPTLTLNGVPTDAGTHATIADLVSALGLLGKRIAIERNGEIVPRSRYADTPIARGDRLEIVGAVGGG
jgi:sulfur carrier protein